MLIPVVYNDRLNAVSGQEKSPSAHKPREMAQYLKSNPSPRFHPVFVDPEALEVSDFQRCHAAEYVADIMDLKIPNGFGTFSPSVVGSLPHTSGAMYKAAKVAVTLKMPTAALVSGFHHAGWNGYFKLGYFCTFNGLMASALRLIEHDDYERVAIIDADYHWGNGTDDIIQHLSSSISRSIKHFSFGKYWQKPEEAQTYLDAFGVVEKLMDEFQPDVILYQSGADCHVDDPFGGMLTEEQMYERDLRMFKISQLLGIPIAWNLAGGYQIDPATGNIDKVLNLHLNTFKACAAVYDPIPVP